MERRRFLISTDEGSIPSTPIRILPQKKKQKYYATKKGKSREKILEHAEVSFKETGSMVTSKSLLYVTNSPVGILVSSGTVKHPIAPTPPSCGRGLLYLGCSWTRGSLLKRN